MNQVWSSRTMPDSESNSKRIVPNDENRKLGINHPPGQEVNDKRWWERSVVYELYVRSYKDTNGDGIGDINGITQSLPYLQELGVDVLWLTPIYPSPNVDNGYDVSDYDAINPEFGTMHDFMILVDQAHKRGMKIMLDQVLNHSSSRHPWFLDTLRRGPKSPYYGYYYWAETPHSSCGYDPPAPNNWGSFVGGSAWTYVPRRHAFYLHLFDKEQPDLNWTNPALREEMFSMLKRWLDRGVDGFRFDVINLIDKDTFADSKYLNREGYGDVERSVSNGPKVCSYLDELYECVLKGRNTITVGETGNVKPEHSVRYAPLNVRGEANTPRLNMIFQFELSHIDRDPNPSHLSVMPLHAGDLKKVITRWQDGVNGKSWNSLYWSNHDQPRAVSRFGNDSTPELRYYSATMLATILFGLQGTPYVYQGEEIGMTNYPFESRDDFRDRDSLERFDYWIGTGHEFQEVMRYLRHFSRDNARTPFQWTGEDNAGFSSTKPWIAVNPNFHLINARKDWGSSCSISRYYRGLIALRHQKEILIEGTYRELLARDPIFMYARENSDRSLIVVANLSPTSQSFNVPQGQVIYGNYICSGTVDTSILRPYEALWVMVPSLNK